MEGNALNYWAEILAFFTSFITSIVAITPFVLKKYPYHNAIRLLLAVSIISVLIYYFTIPLTIDIINPIDKEVVPSPFTIEGTISGNIITKNIPQNHYLWVLVNPVLTPGQYWPQGVSCIQPVNGKWSWAVNLGGERGEIFNIRVALVDAITNRNFEEFVKLGKTPDNYPYITLPGNASSLYEVAVIKGCVECVE
jgi:hypothetical protein